MAFKRLIAFGFLLSIVGSMTLNHGFPLKMGAGALIEDSEIQNLFRLLSDSLIKKNPELSKVQFYVISDGSFNAFAVPHCSLIHPSFSDHPGIFFHTAVLERESLGTVILVLFHEFGHIYGKHSEFFKTYNDNNFFQKLLPTALGCILGGITASLTPILLGLHASGVRSLLSQMRYSRSHESAADSFAFRNLMALNWPVADGLKMLECNARKEHHEYNDLYIRSHPFFEDRARACRQIYPNSTGTFPEHLHAAFEKAKIKLVAFLSPIAGVDACIEGARVPAKIKNYGRAIAAYRQGKTDRALNLLSAFEQDHHGGDAYTWELRSQILFTDGRTAAALKAINKALDFTPKNYNLLIQKSIILLSKPDGFKEVISILDPLKMLYSRHVHLWHWLGMAYSKAGNKGRTQICLAEQSAIMQQWSKAEQHIKLAQTHLSPQDPYFQRSKDLLMHIKDHKK
jgi:predicted Zn-dependent protease